MKSFLFIACLVLSTIAHAQTFGLSGVWKLQNGSDWMESIAPFPDYLNFSLKKGDILYYEKFEGGFELITHYEYKFKRKGTKLGITHIGTHSEKFSDTTDVLTTKLPFGWANMKILSVTDSLITVKTLSNRKSRKEEKIGYYYNVK